MIQNLPHIQLLEQLACLATQGDQPCWLVGGCLRDSLLELSVADFDLAIAGDPTPLAKAWAARQQGTWFWLDRQRRHSRVLLDLAGQQICFDFAPLRAADLHADLQLRDFTINALAVPLRTPLAEQRLIDPLGGEVDLRQRRLRVCSDSSLPDDPLRCLKGVRHSATLNLQPEPASARQLLQVAPQLRRVAAERRRSELGRILAAPDFALGLELLGRFRLFEVLFGQPASALHLQAACRHSLQLQERLQEKSLPVTLQELLNQPLEEEFPRSSVLLLACLLRSYQPDELPKLLAEELRLSRRSQIAISTLAELSAERFKLEPAALRSERCQALWVEGLGPAPVEQLLFALLSDLSTDLTPELTLSLLTAHQRQERHGRIPDLLDGHRLQALLPEEQLQSIGSWHKRIKLAEISGRIDSQAEALCWLQREISD